MARKLQPQANQLYGTPQPLSYDVLPEVVYKRAPTTLDLGFPIGQLWFDRVGGILYILTSIAAGSATWVAVQAAVGPVDTLTGSSGGGAISPAAGNITLTAGTNISATGAGNAITIATSATPTFTGLTTSGLTLKATGAAPIAGITPAMVAGTTTVATTAVAAGSIILLSAMTAGGTQGHLAVSAITPATSFVITSDSALDTSTVSWLIVKPV